MNDRRRPLLPLCLLLFCAARARADVVTLQNGVKLEGILAQDADGETTLRVSADGYVVLDTATAVNVLRQTAAENARLEARWAEQDRRAARKEKAERALAEKRRALGLMLYQGDWVTSAEFDRRLALDKLDLERDLAARPASSQVVVIDARPVVYGVGASFYRAVRPDKLRSYSPVLPPRLPEFSASGNIIRASEFVRPGAHGDARYFDPRTGLYR